MSDCATVHVLLLVHHTNAESARQPLPGLLRFFLENVWEHFAYLFPHAPFPRSSHNIWQQSHFGLHYRMQHLSIAVSPPVFHIFSRFLGGAESPNVELSQYVIFIFLTVLVGQRFLLYDENSCRGRRRGCATDFFWSAGFLFPNQSSCPISGRSVEPLWSAQKAVRLWGSITDLIIIGQLCLLNLLVLSFPTHRIGRNSSDSPWRWKGPPKLSISFWKRCFICNFT